MRVPLNTLILTSDMLVQGAYDPLTSRQEKAAVRLQRNSYRLLAMLDDFVTYVKAEAGELDVNIQPFNLVEQLDKWCAPVRHRTEENGLALHIEVAPAVPATLSGDEGLLKRIVQALLWNAVSFTTQGHIRVTADETDSKLTICVADSGDGIPADDLPHIFEPFWRGEGRPQVPTAGAGLGLPLARALARIMNGDVLLKETSERGSRFCLELPMAVPSEKAME